MAGKPSAASEAARKQFERAPDNAKPSAAAMALKHGITESTIHRTAWYRAYKAAKAQGSEK